MTTFTKVRVAFYIGLLISSGIGILLFLPGLMLVPVIIGSAMLLMILIDQLSRPDRKTLDGFLEALMVVAATSILMPTF